VSEVEALRAALTTALRNATEHQDGCLYCGEGEIVDGETTDAHRATCWWYQAQALAAATPTAASSPAPNTEVEAALERLTNAFATGADSDDGARWFHAVVMNAMRADLALVGCELSNKRIQVEALIRQLAGVDALVAEAVGRERDRLMPHALRAGHAGDCGMWRGRPIVCTCGWDAIRQAPRP
jgi:hypothetical protein